MSRTLLCGDSGMDVVWLDKSGEVVHVIDAIKGRIALVGEEVPILVKAQLSPRQCAQVLTAFPSYKRCFQESGNLVIIDKECF